MSSYCHLNPLETVLFAVAFVVSFDSSSFSAVFRYLGLDDFQILKYKKEIDVLLKRELIVKKRTHRSKNTDYEILQSITNKIVTNAEIQHSKIEDEFYTNEKTLVDLLEEFDAKSDEYDCDDLSLGDFQYYITELCESNQTKPLFREIKKYRLTVFETFFLLDMIWDAIKGGDNDFNTGIQSTIQDYYKQKSRSLNAMNNFVNGEFKLLKLNLIELSQGSFKNQLKGKLSSKMIDLLKNEENLVIENNEVKNEKLISYQKIEGKQLFYNEAEDKQFSNIAQILMDKNFKQLQSKLSQKAMPKGLSILLYGAPGTGKTESVYQIARKTKRNIFKVDISETKSMWFGESQKLMKKIFDNYRQMQKTEKLCPILLFNEADAIIGKRKQSGSSNTADTENAIQNIILEEMENFDGILFATTNLVSNMDAAFERRFLFKVKFDKPGMLNAAKIWKSKLPFLSQHDCKTLASNFNFSGGEMENIARKIVMSELLHDLKPSLNQVLQFCKEEKWETKHNTSIGFVK